MTRLAGYATRTQHMADIDSLLSENEVLAEHYAAAAAAILSLKAEDDGWAPLNRVEREDGFDIESLREIAEHAELQTTGNPLLKRGYTLRRDYVFGKGIKFETAGAKVPPRYQDIIEDPINQKTLFEPDALARNERALFVTGNLFVAYDQENKEFFKIPIDQISNYASNPNAKGDVHYYQRTYNEIDPSTNKPASAPTIEWYPVLERWEKRSTRELQKTIENKPVNDNFIVIDLKVNRPDEHVWGVPDCLPAMPYAWAHAEYIRDASKLLKALSTIAWKVVGKSKANTVNAAAKMATGKKPASTAAMTDGTDLISMPKSGQVDMKDGLAIAGYVASALEVSLVALTADPGAASGSYGAAATLDAPSANSARARQFLWANFFKRIYRVLGFKEILVNFPKIQEDPVFRNAQTLTLGFSGGAIFQNEYRKAFLEATDVDPIEAIEALPEPSPFTAAAQYSAEAIAKEEAVAQQEADNAQALAKVSGQGQSNPAGKVSAGTNDLRKMDSKPGTGA